MQRSSESSAAFGVTALLLLAVASGFAQSLSPIYTFQETNDLNPTAAGLLLVSNALYGTIFGAEYNGGGRSNPRLPGTLFKLNTDGTAFTNLYSFSEVDHFSLTNTDGANPLGQLVFSGNKLYGTAGKGGFYGNGTVFAIDTDGTGFTNLHTFGAYGRNGAGFDTNGDGAAPTSGLMLSGNRLYGTTSTGGTLAGGTVFAISTDGTGFTNLYNFTASSTSRTGAKSTLILSGNTLYGTTQGGGAAGNGMVYGVDTDGTGFTNLHDFSAFVRMTTSPFSYTNSDGATPYGALVLSAGRLYGTTFQGGTNTNNTGLYSGGTVFGLNTDGTDFTTLRNAGGSDGTSMMTGLAVSGNVLYGVAPSGSFGEGTVFAMKTDGSDFALLNSFILPTYNSANNSYTNLGGAIPKGDLVFSGSKLYGVTGNGGTNAGGTIFALDLTVSPPPIQFTADPSNGITRLVVHFNSPAVDASGNAIVSWNWSFGDGSNNISTVQNPSHTYTNAATYLPTLTCINSYGNTVLGFGPAITVNPLPRIQFTATPTIGLPPPVTVHFTSPAQDDGSNAIVSWNWNFGDGSTSTAQNPSHIYTNAGTFFPGLTCINFNHDTSTGSGPAIDVLNSLLLNGGFETITFTNWTQSGYTNATTRVTSGSTFAHSGKDGAKLFAPGSAGVFGFLSQTLATTAGASYLISFWLDSPFDSTPNDFQVLWNGNVVFDQTNIGSVGWTNIQLTVTATATHSTIEFGYLTGSLYFGLDDAGVASVNNGGPTQPGISSITLSGADITLNSADGIANQTYYVLMSNELTDPLSQWTRVATNVAVTSGNFSITLTNAVRPNAEQNFFILQIP